MINLREQLRHDLERDARRAAAAARGENPDAVDIYDLAKRPSIVDIKRIIDELPDPVYDGSRGREATDAALDGLENIESVIDAGGRPLGANGWR